MKKRILSWLLIAVMVFGMIPAVAPVQVQAAQQEAPQMPKTFAGGCDGNHEGWIPISDAENKIVSDTSAKYYLTNDVDTIHTYTNQDAHVTVCLNGHSIVGSKGFTCLGSYAGSVTIADCKGTGVVDYGLDVGKYTTGTTNNIQRPVMILEGGIYRKWTRVNVGATLIMNGGHLEGTSAKYASLVSYGTVTINGGYITQTNGQPGVRIERKIGSFTMNGGVIDVPQNNGIYNSAIARFYIYGGTIYDRGLNGAVRLEGETRVELEGVVRILGKGIIVGDTTIDPIFRYYKLQPGSEVWISTEKADDVRFCTSHSETTYLHAYGDDRVILHNDNQVILHKHGSWQGATCVTPATCGAEGCNQTGPTDSSVHASIGPWQNTVQDGVQKHFRACKDCGVTVVEGICEGGVATCVSEGVCQICNAAYLPVDPENHASQERYVEYIDDATHGIYHSCCDVLKETQTHTPATGAEATCKGVATCGVCNIAYGSTDETNHAGKLVWLYSSKQKHIQVWDCCNTPNTDLEKHNMVYTADGLTIIGKCAQCEAGGTVTMSVSGGTYTGYAFEATTEGTEDLGGWDAFEEPVLTYCCAGGCKKAGTHTVTMTMGTTSVSETFTITPKTLTIDTVYANDKSYDGSDIIALRSFDLDGVVVYHAGQYAGEWDDDRDDVRIVEDEQLVMTVADSVPGYYATAAITGIRLEGSDADNYVIAESLDAVQLRNENGFEYEIRYRDVFVTIEDQNLVGTDAQVDQSKYILEDLGEQFTIEGIALYDNGWGQIDLDTSSVVVRLGDQDVTEHFNFVSFPGNVSYTCEGHSVNSNGFCATGQCNSYQPAEKYVQLDDWGNEVTWYEVSNAGQLYWVAEQVNVYHNGYLNVRLMDNITVNEDLTAENLRSWTPIGNLYANYCGEFDGNGFTISGLYLSDPEMDYVGLFGYTSYNYPITDVHLTNSYFEGNSNVGGLFGNAGSNISGCSVSDTVTVKGNSNLGGIAGGSQFGELTNSYSMANIIPGEESYDGGGLVGYNYMRISNCYTTDSVIVGGNNASYGGEFSNTFFLADADDDLEGTTPMTMEQLCSGQIASLLQAGIQGEEIYDEETDSYITLEPEQIWGQTIGEGFPMQGDQKVYEVLNCKGEIGYSNTDEPLGHNFENGACTVCGAADPDVIQKFDIDVARMILGNALEFQFGVAKTKIPDKTGYYAVIEKTWADGTTTTKTIPAAEWGVAGQYWAIVYDGLAAKEMGDTFYVTIYNAKGEAVSNPKQDAVRDYVARAYASQSATGKTMMVDMLNYGAAAQLHFGYGTNDLANSKLTAAQLATGTATTPEMSNDQVKGTNYQGSRFILESRIQVQLAFKNMTSDMYAIYTYTNAAGKEQTVRVEGKDLVVIGGKPAGVELSALVYADARALVEVTVYNADGTVYGTATDSIESCSLRSGGDVFVALMKFADSAKAHLYG